LANTTVTNNGHAKRYPSNRHDDRLPGP
jgi:hypothetical protein